jgi:hypothetical protein
MMRLAISIRRRWVLWVSTAVCLASLVVVAPVLGLPRVAPFFAHATDDGQPSASAAPATVEQAERQAKESPWSLLERLTDSGPPSEIESAKQAIITLYNENLALDVGKRVPAGYTTRLQRVFTPDTARQEAEDVERGHALATADDVLSSESLTVDQWLGVKVTGPTAVALADTHEHYVQERTGRRSSRPFRYQFELLKVGQQWKILRYVSVPQNL